MKKSQFTEEQITYALPEAELRRLKQLEDENRKLKQLVADAINLSVICKAKRGPSCANASSTRTWQTVDVQTPVEIEA